MDPAKEGGAMLVATLLPVLDEGREKGRGVVKSAVKLEPS